MSRHSEYHLDGDSPLATCGCLSQTHPIRSRTSGFLPKGILSSCLSRQNVTRDPPVCSSQNARSHPWFLPPATLRTASSSAVLPTSPGTHVPTIHFPACPSDHYFSFRLPYEVPWRCHPHQLPTRTIISECRGPRQAWGEVSSGLCHSGWHPNSSRGPAQGDLTRQPPHGWPWPLVPSCTPSRLGLLGLSISDILVHVSLPFEWRFRTLQGVWSHRWPYPPAARSTLPHLWHQKRLPSIPWGP